MKVIKRDGREVDFNFSKVVKAVNMANKNLEEPVDSQTINTVLFKIKSKIDSLTTETIEIEQIQDIVLVYLKKYCKRLYKVYKKYREERAKVRDLKTNGKYYDTILELVRGIQNDTSKENSNKDTTQIHVIRDLIAGETSKKLFREFIMSPKLKDLHDRGVLHVHDCDYRLQKETTNCELSDLENVLQNGTVMNGKLIEKPKSLRTACTIASQVITAVSSSTYGGQTITLSHLAPFVEISRQKLKKKLPDNLVEEFLRDEIKDSIQTLLYQLNTIATTNGQ